MNLLHFKSEFKSFRFQECQNFENLIWNDTLEEIIFLSVFNKFFSSGKSFLYQCKKGFFRIKSETIFIVNFQSSFGNSLLKPILIIASLNKHSENSRVNVLYKFCK